MEHIQNNQIKFSLVQTGKLMLWQLCALLVTAFSLWPVLEQLRVLTEGSVCVEILIYVFLGWLSLGEYGFLFYALRMIKEHKKIRFLTGCSQAWQLMISVKPGGLLFWYGFFGILMPFIHCGFYSAFLPNINLAGWIRLWLFYQDAGQWLYYALLGLCVILGGLLFYAPALIANDHLSAWKAVKQSIDKSLHCWQGWVIVLITFFLSLGFANLAPYPPMEWTDFSFSFPAYFFASSFIRIQTLWYLLYNCIWLLCSLVTLFYTVHGLSARDIRDIKENRTSLRPVLLPGTLIVLLAAAGYIWVPGTLKSSTLVIAGHKGSLPAIGNTVEALEDAAAFGADYSELDPQLSKDGVLVIFHDDNVYDLTGTDADISDLTWEQIQNLTLHEDGQEGKIPDLSEMIAAAKENEIGLMMDLKSDNSTASQTASTVMELVEQSDFSEYALIQATNKKTADLLMEWEPSWTIGYVETGQFGRTSLLNSPDYINVRWNQISVTMIEECQRKGVDIYVWSVDDPQLLSSLAAVGIKGAVGDDVRKMLADQSLG